MQLHCRKWHRWPASCWKPGRDKNGFPCRSQRKHGPADTLIWTWSLQSCEMMNFCRFKAPSLLYWVGQDVPSVFFFSIQCYGKTQKDFLSNPILCYGRPRKPIQSAGRRKTIGLPPALLAEGTFVAPLRTHLLDPLLQ